MCVCLLVRDHRTIDRRPPLGSISKDTGCGCAGCRWVEKSASCGKKVQNYSRKMKMNAGMYYIINIKIHSSGEIEDFVATHLCKLRVILRSRVLLGV